MRIRSKKLRDSARGQDCTLRIPNVCNFNPETTVLAHVGRDSGMGMKCSDNMAVFACSNCHDQIDNRSGYYVNSEDIANAKLQGIEETQQIWVNEELLNAK